MQSLTKLMLFIPALIVSSTQASDYFCLQRIKQSSVDFPTGSVIRTTCRSFAGLSADVAAEEKIECERKSRRNRAKAWESGTCPAKDLLSSCLMNSYGPAGLDLPSTIYTYVEIGGNLSLDAQIELARRQCGAMTGMAGSYKVLYGLEGSADSTTDTTEGKQNPREQPKTPPARSQPPAENVAPEIEQAIGFLKGMLDQYEQND